MIAIIFPGQGSQKLGMQSELARDFKEIKLTYQEASRELGYDLWKLAQGGVKEKLDKTEVTQPLMLTAGVAAWRVWRNHTDRIPKYMAGHSLGEYTALVCSESLQFKEALRLVQKRAQLMQAAIPEDEGSMAAILGLDDDILVRLCTDESNDELVAPVNFNSPGQIVIAGNKNAVQRVIDRSKSVGAKRALLLDVSVPSHCLLMKPTSELLLRELQNISINKPTISVVNNAKVEQYQTPDQIKEGLQKQLYSPVRWSEIINYFISKGVTEIIECGPGRVLTGLSKRINKNILATSMDSSDIINQYIKAK